MTQEHNRQTPTLRSILGFDRLGVSFYAAVSLSALGVVAALSFRRAEPPVTPEAPGIRVDANTVSLTASAPQWSVLKLGVATPPARRWSDTFPARFKVDESNASKVGSPLAGRVSRVFVELGQTIKAGAPLFSIASPDIATLRVEQQKAAIDLDVAKTAYERTKAMVQARALPGKDELESEQQLRQAELALRLAQTKLSSLQVSAKSENEFTVAAPRAGVVIEKNLLPAQQVGSGESVVTIADLGTIWVVADLFEADAVGLTPGTPARVTSPSLPGFSVEAPTDTISAVVDPDRHTLGVRIKLDNSAGNIHANAYAEVSFLMTPLTGAVEVAATSLVSNGAKQYVYVEDTSGHFVRRDVVAGGMQEGRTIIVSGLRPGETVVEQGATLLDNQIDLSSS